MAVDAPVGAPENVPGAAIPNPVTVPVEQTGAVQSGNGAEAADPNQVTGPDVQSGSVQPLDGAVVRQRTGATAPPSPPLHNYNLRLRPDRRSPTDFEIDERPTKLSRNERRRHSKQRRLERINPDDEAHGEEKRRKLVYYFYST